MTCKAHLYTVLAFLAVALMSSTALQAQTDRIPGTVPIEMQQEWEKQNPNSLPQWITPEEMGATYVRIASDPALENMTGLSFDEKCRPVRMPRFAYNDEAAARLWKISEQMVGLT